MFFSLFSYPSFFSLSVSPTLFPLSSFFFFLFLVDFAFQLGFPSSSAGKESSCNVGDLGSIPGLGRSSGGGHGNTLQYSGLENSMDCTVHGVRHCCKGFTYVNSLIFTITLKDSITIFY